MNFAGKKITVQTIHGRQYIKENGEWREYSCIRHEGKGSYDIRVTDTIPHDDRLMMVAEEILLIAEEHRPKQQQKGKALRKADGKKRT